MTKTTKTGFWKDVLWGTLLIPIVLPLVFSIHILCWFGPLAIAYFTGNGWFLLLYAPSLGLWFAIDERSTKHDN